VYLFGKIIVKPQLPDNISKLYDIANNIWWTWNINSLILFKSLDPVLWKKVNKNPIRFLKEANQNTLVEASNNPEFMNKYNQIVEQFDGYMNNQYTWYNKNYPMRNNDLIAYFSAEYGLDETLPIYAGGLGILSGDHCKSASDLGLPFVAIGLLYKQGYSNQIVNADGKQSYEPVDIDIEDLPILPVKDENNNDIIFDIDYLDRKLYIKIWKIHVGKINLYLLDTDIEPNNCDDRILTQRLYGGGTDTRISQEIILGIGGLKALKTLNLEPTVYHMNEGHSSFVGIELIKKIMHEQHVSYNVAQEIAMSKLIFTTHTPVPAGNDIFDFALVEKYFSNYWGYLGLNKKEFLELGLKPAPAYNQGFNMGVLGFKLAGKRNGVSKLHESVTKDLFGDIWPNLSHSELPITHITNGIHTCTWLQPRVKDLYNKYFEPFWQDKIHIPEVWNAIYTIPDEELWNVHKGQKQKLINLIKENIRTQMERNGKDENKINEMERSFTTDCLIIGFARRFSTYKRSTLIFRDLERFSKIILNSTKPILLVFSGKAHPADVQGQELIKYILDLCKKPQFRGKIVFLEDYNMKISRYLISGCDVWLNNPRRPLEASGTSGEKAAVNGIINFSILDGWWFEAYNGQNGWAIGNVNTYKTFDAQDDADCNSIYDILENEIIPLYYTQNENGIPHGWIKIMKNSISSCGHQYSTQRMVIEYMQNMYFPQIEKTISEDFKNTEKVLEFYNWKNTIKENWNSVKIYQNSNLNELVADAGNNINVSCIVESPDIDIDSLAVEVYFARIAENGTLDDIQITKMTPNLIDEGKYECTAQIQLVNGGKYAYTFRIVPYNPMMINTYDLDLIKWINE